MNNQQALNSTRASTSSSEIPLRLESALHQGQVVTLVRDAQGHIAYPQYVPPETTSPISPPTPASKPRRQEATEASPDGGSPAQQKTDLAGLKKDRRPSPSLWKKWTTQSPLTARRRFSSHSIRRGRAETKVNHSNKRLRFEEPGQGGETPGIDSSSDEDGDAAAYDGERGVHPTSSRSKYRQQRPNNDRFKSFQIGNEHFHTKGNVSKKDGRLNITLQDKTNTGYLAKAIGSTAKKVIPSKSAGKSPDAGQEPTSAKGSASASTDDTTPCPRLNIVIMVIGSRGDAQPFLSIGKILKEQGHRVRIATHPAFREFVEKDSDLEFFSVGGDPADLMAFMVKNPGMIPTLETVKAGDIGKRRSAMAEMFEGFWRACINATDDEKDSRNLKMMGQMNPFVADAIIANPPSFAHIHCAEALGIPLHLMFTFPYTPTQAFPHPLASIKKSNVDPGYTNFISYPLVEMMVWQGLGDLVNNFRVKTLGLDPVSTLWAPGATYRLHVPFTYLWSPGLVPKPSDWGDEIDVSGFVFLDLASTFNPPDPLTRFLDAGGAPIYLGFGSIVVDDADRFTHMIFEAVKLAGVRALVSKGWGGLGGDSLDVPENIFLLDNTPHDWLFPKVRACVIHGGAGTTAIALKCGIPTFIIPFFGDQHFWGTMVAKAKAGPEPIPYKHLTAEKLAEGIKYCLSQEAAEAAADIGRSIESEGDGARNACQSFQKHMVLNGKHSMRCSILEDRVAVWHLKKTSIRLSALAAHILTEQGYISWRKLRLLRSNQYNDFEGPGEPVTGAAGSLMSSLGEVFSGIGAGPYRLAKSTNRGIERRQRRKDKKKLAKSKLDKDNQALHDRASEAEERPSSDVGHTRETTEASSAQETAQSSGTVKARSSELPSTQTRRSTGSFSTETHESVSENSEDPDENLVDHVGHGAFKSAKALATAPVDFFVAVAQGFHNAPRLYGDDTVRRPPRITGVRSGLRAAGHEFAFGIYDGWSGLVRLPVRGARNGGGPRGFVTGVGMGLTGFVLKDIAALVGPISYTLKGFVKQAERRRQPTKYIRSARIIQGQREMSELDDEKQRMLVRDVIHGWGLMRGLWQVLENRGQRKEGLRRKLGLRRTRDRGVAFEGVSAVERALTDMQREEVAENAAGEDEGATSLRDEAEPETKALDAGRKPESAMDETETNSDVCEGNPNTNTTNPGSKSTNVQGIQAPGTGRAESSSTDHAAKVLGVPEREKDNPFVATAEDMAKNREANKEAKRSIITDARNKH